MAIDCTYFLRPIIDRGSFLFFPLPTTYPIVSINGTTKFCHLLPLSFVHGTKCLQQMKYGLSKTVTRINIFIRIFYTAQFLHCNLLMNNLWPFYCISHNVRSQSLVCLCEIFRRDGLTSQDIMFVIYCRLLEMDRKCKIVNISIGANAEMANLNLQLWNIF